MLTQCPLEIITPDVRTAIQAADDLENHAGWPSGAGWLNEPKILVDAVRFARNANAMAKAQVLKQPQF
jgi:hypothetical protein